MILSIIIAIGVFLLGWLFIYASSQLKTLQEREEDDQEQIEYLADWSEKRK